MVFSLVIVYMSKMKLNFPLVIISKICGIDFFPRISTIVAIFFNFFENEKHLKNKSPLAKDQLNSQKITYKF